MNVGQIATPAWRRPARVELYLTLVVLLVAWTGCRLYLPAFRAAGGRSMSYYGEFGPAVMSACGYGFVNPLPQSVPELDVFLKETEGTFDCRTLNGHVTLTPVDLFQSVTRNLLFAAAAVWRVTGVSWNALDNLVATMFGVTLTAAYLVMRFVMGPSLAIVGTLLWGLSPMHLANAPHLRDYSKAPFFALTALAMALAIRAQRPKTLIALGVVFGLVQGIGFGMRTDIVLNFAPFFLVLLALGGGGLLRNIRWKIVAASVSVLVFVIVSWPVLTGYGHSEGLWHVSLLGLTTPFDQALSLRPAPYDFGYLYDDSYISTVVHAYWRRMHDPTQASLYAAGLYNTACREYYKLLVATFPADFLTRMAGSALHVLNLPFSIEYGIVPQGFTEPLLSRLAVARSWLMIQLIGIGPSAALYLLMLIGIRDRIATCVGFLLLTFWATYPYLQLHGRHVFHLEILPIAIVLWAAHLTWRTIADARVEGRWRHERKRALLSLATIAGLVVATLLGVSIARAVQKPRARALLERYANAPADPLEAPSARVDGWVRLTPALFEPAGQQPKIQQAMLVLEAKAGCDASRIRVHVRYGGGEQNFSRDLEVPVGSGASRIFLPVYAIDAPNSVGVSRFVSIDVPASLASCVRLSRARELERVPLLLDATLSPEWLSQPMYERLYLGPVLPERVWVRVARWLPRLAKLG